MEKRILLFLTALVALGNAQLFAMEEYDETTAQKIAERERREPVYRQYMEAKRAKAQAARVNGQTATTTRTTASQAQQTNMPYQATKGSMPAQSYQQTQTYPGIGGSTQSYQPAQSYQTEQTYPRLSGVEQSSQPEPTYPRLGGAEQSVPAYEQPAPAYEQPAPAYEQPAPAYEQPAKSASKPHHTFYKNSTPHEVLGVARGASPAEVKQAFKEQASFYHPDHFIKNQAELHKIGVNSREEANAKMTQINAARSALLKK